MSAPGTLAAALAQLPSWWAEAADPFAFDTLFGAWHRASGWRGCGFAWTGESEPVVRVANGTVSAETPPPPEVPDALRRLKAGEHTVSYSVQNSSGRVYSAVQPAGRGIGVLWAEKAAGQPWTDAERAFVGLSARTIERSPALALLVGPVVDAERLNQRLADAALIAGRMAHDFDNLLQGIIGFSDLTLPLVPPGSQASGFVSEIGKVGQRGIQFTQQLHNLSRSAHTKPNPGSVPLAVSKEEARLKPITPLGARVEKDFPAGLPAVAMEAGPLQVVLGHLLENAIEATPQGGTVRVSARPVELSDADARTYIGRAGAGAHLQVTVADAGPGIKPEVRRRLFVEPFYTTKVRHRGLGLAIAYRALSAHRGGVRIESVPAPDTGTLVRVVLPLAAARPPVVPVGPVAATAAAGGY